MPTFLATRIKYVEDTAEMIALPKLKKGDVVGVETVDGHDYYVLASGISETIDDWDPIGGEVDLTDIENELADKVSNSAFQTLTTTVGNKADSSTVTSLSNSTAAAIATKVSKNDTLEKGWQRSNYFNRMVPVSNRPGHGLPTTSDAVFTWSNSIIAHIATCDIENPALTYANFYDGDDASQVGSITVSAAIEYNGSVVAAYFGASRSVTIAAGIGGITSNPVGLSIPVGATYYVRTLVIATTGTRWPNLLTFRRDSGEGVLFGTGTATDKTLSTGVNAVQPGISFANAGITSGSTNITLTGYTTGFTTTDTGRTVTGTGIPVGTTLTYISATQATLSQAATATNAATLITINRPGLGCFTAQNVVCSMPSIGNKAVDLPVVAVVGDSIAYGLREIPPETDMGFANRALNDANPRKAHVRVDRSGSTAQGFALPSSGTNGRDGSQRRAPMLEAGNYMIEEFGVNDLNGGRTLVQLQTDVIAIWRKGKRHNAKAYRSTLTPYTTSTTPYANPGDSFTTLAGQTTTVWEPLRVQFNDWVRDGAPMDTNYVPVATGTNPAGVIRMGGYSMVGSNPLHPAWKFFDLASAVESSQNSGKWKISAMSGVLAITSGSPQVTVVSGDFQTGQLIVGVGLAANTVVSSGGGVSTPPGTVLTLSANATATNATATVYEAYTSDGIHPSPVMYAAMAATVPVGDFV